MSRPATWVAVRPAGSGTITRGSVTTALLASDGSKLLSEPADVVFPAATLTALQHAIGILPKASQFTVLLPNHRVEASRLRDGRILANLFLRREGDSFLKVPAGPVLDGTAFLPRVTVHEPGPASPKVRPRWAATTPVEERQAAGSSAKSEPGSLTTVLQAVMPEPAQAAVELVEKKQAESPEPVAPVRAQIAPITESARVVANLRRTVIAQPRRQELRPEWPLIATAALVLFALAGALAFWAPGWLRNQRTAEVRITPSSGVIATQVTAMPSATGTPRPSRVATTPTPTSSISAPPPISLMYTGDLAYRTAGDGVRALQARLRQLHYFTYPVDTGYFGDATYGAVYTFQQVRGLATTGVADRMTIAALNACDQSCVY